MVAASNNIFAEFFYIFCTVKQAASVTISSTATSVITIWYIIIIAVNKGIVATGRKQLHTKSVKPSVWAN